MTVFTIFCHGTEQSRKGDNKSGEIIRDLSDLAAGTEYQDFLILDGPGSDLIKLGFKRGSLTPGSFDPYTRDKIKKSDSPSWSKTDNYILDMNTWDRNGNVHTWTEDPEKTYQNVQNGLKESNFSGRHFLKPFQGVLKAVLNKNNANRGGVYGEGMDDNIRHAISTISETWNGNFAGKTLNLIGWSRGAVTCIRMSNWIKEFLGSDININIFAIDPVAGNDLGEMSADTFIIPDIVKKFIGIIVQDDKRGGYKPQDISRLKFQSAATEVAFLPIPGSHDSLVKVNKDDNHFEVPYITRYLAYHFLNENGTNFNAVDEYSRITPANLTELYAAIKLKQDSYKNLGKSNFEKAAQGGIIQRRINTELDKYISHNTDFFVNEHHVECFKKAHLNTYNIFFKMQPHLPPPPITRNRSNAIFAPPIPLRRGAITGLSPNQKAMGSFQVTSPASFKVLEQLGAITTTPSGPIVKSGHLACLDNGASSTGRSMLRSITK